MLRTVRNPRGYALSAINECLNPSFETNLDYWSPIWYGQGGAGTNTRNTVSRYTNSNGSCLMQMTLTATPSAWGDIGWEYVDNGWSAGVTTYAAAFVASIGRGSQWTPYARFLDANGNELSRTAGQTIDVPSSSWQRIALSLTAPAGTVKTAIRFALSGSGSNHPANGDQLWIDAVAISRNRSINYFDGTTANGTDGDFQYRWEGTAHASRSYQLGPDPASSIDVPLVEGWDESIQPGNVVHQLLDAGSVAIVAATAYPRTGTIKMVFSNDSAAASRAAAHACRGQHAIPGVWTYQDDSLPETSLHYVVNGPVRCYVSASRRYWRVDVPFQEVPA
jgi:hypothetical protein